MKWILFIVDPMFKKDVARTVHYNKIIYKYVNMVLHALWL